jgi:hypothetical protein
MAMQAIPWQGWLLLMVLVAITVQRTTQIHYQLNWLQLAPEKARDVVLALRAENKTLRQENAELQEQRAELRGRIEAIKIQVEPSRKLELVYGWQPRAKEVCRS